MYQVKLKGGDRPGYRALYSTKRMRVFIVTAMESALQLL